MKKAIILSIGTELTEGRITDTHGRYLSSILTECGFNILRMVQIPDDEGIVEVVKECSTISDLLIITGGLGPTEDDMTRKAVAGAAGLGLDYYPEVWDAMKQKYGGKISESNKNQAYIPSGFNLMDNPNGSAPGFSGLIGNCFAVILPGPPRELGPMFETSGLESIRNHFKLEKPSVFEGTALLIAESTLGELLTESAVLPVYWGTRTRGGSCSFFFRGGTEAQRLESFERLVLKAGPVLIRKGDYSSIPELKASLEQSGLSLSGAESCTGGMISEHLTAYSGISRVFWGSAVVYDNKAKMVLLSVPKSVLDEYGAVSKLTVEWMLKGILKVSGTDAAFAVSGVAGPEGGTSINPVGTVYVGCALRNREDQSLTTYIRRFQFRGNRETVREKTAEAAIIMTCLMLNEKNAIDTDANWTYI